MAVLSGSLNEQTVRHISQIKHEPKWMLDIRLKAYREYSRLPMPKTYVDLDELDINNLCFYNAPLASPADRWEAVPDDIKSVYQQIGLPEAEQKYLAGAQAQYNSGMIYERLKEKWQDLGIIFTDTDTAVQKYPKLVKKYFTTVVPYKGNKFAALNTAVWSGGSFIYIPPNVRLPIPLQAYFRINISNLGQFERSLIIVDHDASLQYVEGCTAPIFNTNSLHNSVVEIIVKPRSRMRYTGIQNWSTNVYNIVNSRMRVEQDSVGEWIDGNIGSCATIKCPSVELVGEHAVGNILSLSTATTGQHQDTGGKAIHFAPHTSSTIISKSISSGSGVCTYHGKVQIRPTASHAQSSTKCDALLIDHDSVSNTFPHNVVARNDAKISHEASVSRLDRNQLFYLMSRGLDENQASSMLVNGFIDPIVQTLPMEYASELNRLIKLSMKGAIG